MRMSSSMNFQLAAWLIHWLTYFKCIRVHAQIYGSGVPTGAHDSPRGTVYKKNKSSLSYEDGHIRQTDVTLFFFFSASFTHFLYLKENCLHRWGKKLHWQKVVWVTLELPQWILSRNCLLIPREATVATFLVHLPTPWRGINSREEYHY